MYKPKPTKKDILDSANRCGVSKDSISITKISNGLYSVLIYKLSCSNFISDLKRMYNVEIENIFSHPIKVNIKSYE